MGKFNVEENLSIIIRLMLEMGIWPKENPSVSYMMRGCATILFFVSFLLSTVTRAFEFVDVQSSSFALCCSMATFQAIIKCFVLFTKRKHFFGLLRTLHEPILSLHDSHLYIYLTKKMKMYRTFQYVYLSCSLGTGILISISPMFNAKSEKPVPVPFPMDMEKQSLLVYVIVWLFQIFATILVCASLGCTDGLILFFNSIASAELRILREKIMETTNFQSFDSERIDIENFNNTINKLLKDCVIQHLAIERYILCIQTVFGNIFLLQLLVSLLLTCFLGFVCILIPVTSIDFGMAVVFFISVSIELALLCVAGNEITLQSEKIRDACYMSQWLECGPSVRKTLFIIMERSKRPIRLSAVNFAFLSIDTLVSVFRVAYTYFTVLKQMYGEYGQT